MAFCNSCGSTLDADAKFCSKCGAAQIGLASGASGVAPVSVAPTQGSSALRPLLIALAAALVLGAAIIAVVIAFGLHVARQTHVHNRNGGVRIESPFGTVESTSNPSDIARQLGIELYPDARLLKGNAANVNVAGMHTVAAEFETDDPAEKVADFYKEKLPNAQYSSAGDRYSIVSNEKDNLVTIQIEARDGKTAIKVASVTGKGVTGSND